MVRFDEVAPLRILAQGRPSGYFAWEVAYLLSRVGLLAGRTVRDVARMLDDLARRELVEPAVIDLRRRSAVSRYVLTTTGHGAVA